MGVLLLPWGCVGGSYWGSSSAVGDVLGVVIGVLLLPWGCVGGSYWGSSSVGRCVGGSYWGSSSAVGMCWG